MTRDQGVARIKEQLAFRTTLDNEIVSQMQLAQIALESMPVKPWFLVSEDSFTLTAVGEERIELPDDFLEEVEEAVLKYVPDDSEQEEVDLKKDDYDVLRGNYKDLSTGVALSGEPEAYALLGAYFRLFPTPDAEYTIRMIYYKKDTVLDTNVENGWLKWAPLLILGSAGKLIAEGPARDQVATKVFNEWVATGTALLDRQNEARMHANRRYQIGGPHN